jgi:small subunit ribosomal protein S6
MILSPEATEEEAAATVERVTGFITDCGGSISETVAWGVRRLAYPIAKFMEGNYVLTRFSLEAEDAVQFDRNLKTSRDVLRHLVTKAPKPKVTKVPKPKE